MLPSEITNTRLITNITKKIFGAFTEAGASSSFYERTLANSLLRHRLSDIVESTRFQVISFCHSFFCHGI